MAGELSSDVIVVGAGPVGAFLAIRLAQTGAHVRVLDAQPVPRAGSRAIGLHPAGLSALATIDAAAPLLEEAARVRTARVTSGPPGEAPRTLGRVELDALPPPYPFVATVPQSRTEAVLEARLEAAGVDVERGWRVEGIGQDAAAAWTRARCGREVRRDRARLVVACDGARGTVARLQGVARPVRRHDAAFVMADGADATGFGGDAVLHFGPEGVVESFPLPGGARRWVVRVGRRRIRGDAASVAALVARRSGERLDPATVVGASRFRPRRARAVRLAAGRVWYCGDAAHELSPIGGRGLNLGLVGAQSVAEAAEAVLAGRVTPDRAGAGYAALQRRRAGRAARIAALATHLGRGAAWPWLAPPVLRALTGPLGAAWAARLFTMSAPAPDERAGAVVDAVP